MKILTLLSRHAVRFTFSSAVIFILLLHATGISTLTAISRLENFAYDVRLNMLMPGNVDERIVIIDIDEKSLKEQGRWPWSRNKLADLVNKLFDGYHVKVLGVDVVFAEKDESSGLKRLEEIKSKYLASDQAFGQAIETLRASLDYDQVFADSLKRHNVVLGYFFLRGKEPSISGHLPKPSFVDGEVNNYNSQLIVATGYGANLEILQNSTNSAGHFNSDPDEDGISRKVPMLIKYSGKMYEAFSLAVARAVLDSDSNRLRSSPIVKIQAGPIDDLGTGEHYSGIEWLKLGSHKIPVNEEMAALVPYRGPQGSFHYVSATDVLNQKVNPAKLRNKIVLLGTTAAGLMDLRATPVQNIYAGVEVHANMIAGILDNNIKENPAYTQGAELLLLLLVGLFLAFKLPELNPLMATAVTLVTVIVVITLNLSAWEYGNLVLPIASLLVMVTSIYFINMSYGFFIESRAKRQLAGLFGQYVPPELVNEMAENPSSYSLEGESREMTVLFSDVRGFTTISEGLDPKQLTHLMNDFLTPMTHVIHHNRGTIDKYMGDAIMAFWGAPLPDNNHAKHALQAAFGMIVALEKLQQEFVSKGFPTISIGIGLNTGEMIVGNMGSKFRMAYTIMGDAVNLGSRLESLTKNYGVYIIVSEYTKAQVPEYIYRELDIVRVKGKDKPVAIFEPISIGDLIDQATKNSLARYMEALKLYRSQSWDLAEAEFIQLQKLEPERYLYAIYLERIAFFRKTPPGDDWDGVFNFVTK